jgi:hypothetical protein
MAFPDLKQLIFEDEGIGPKFRKDKVPVLAYVGEIRLLPFDPDDLPNGWLFCNGDLLSQDSEAGAVLASLPATFRARWGIVAADGYVSVPNLFGGNGEGYFPRPVNGATRQAGSVQADAIRNIKTGPGVTTNWYADHKKADGIAAPFYSLGVLKDNYGNQWSASSSYALHYIGFDASLCVPTAGENRPANIGMTPAFYVGVNTL